MYLEIQGGKEMNEFPYQEPHPMGGTDSEPEPRTIHGSITPKWLREFEKEQQGKLGILRGVVQIKRNDAFTESAFGSREKKMQMQAMVNAYDVVLKLIGGRK